MFNEYDKIYMYIFFCNDTNYKYIDRLIEIITTESVSGLSLIHI